MYNYLVRYRHVTPTCPPIPNPKQVAAQEEDAEAQEEAEQAEHDERLELEQAFYAARLAGVLAKAGGEKKVKKGTKKKRGVEEEEVQVAVPERGEAPTLPSAAEEGEGAAAAEIVGMLKAKKKRRKQQQEEEMGRDYVAFDPLDWRSKQFG